MFFGFDHDGTLCHHIVPEIIIYKTRSKDDIHFIKSCQFYILSRYGQGVTV